VNVLVAGSTGLIGTALVDRLERDGHTVVRLVRGSSRPSSSPAVRWDPGGGTFDRQALADVGPIDAAVDLAGAGIGDRRWSPARKQEIRQSRVDSTALIADMVVGCTPRPHVLVNASAVGFYGDRGDEILTETSTNGSGFLAQLCRAWEEATAPAADAGIRTVLARNGIVLSPRGGALGRQLPLFRLGLGGRLGPGTQFRSWISLEDELAALARCLEDDGLSGPVNLTAPEPVTDADFAAALGRAVHRPARLPAPAAALWVTFGAEMASEMLLSGQRVVPAALVSHGFGFTHATLDDALRWVVAQSR
jgi:uncharacterized protein